MKAKLLLSISIFSVFAGIVKSQEGTPYISNYPIHSQTRSIFWDIEESKNGMLFFANREGIFAFDGKNWEYISTPSLPLTLKRYDEKLYLGLRNGFGQIIITNTGIYKYEPILNADSLGDISRIIGFEDFISIVSENYVLLLNKEDYSIISEFKAYPENPFSDIFTMNNQLFVCRQSKGLFLVSEDSLQLISEHEQFIESSILFGFNYSEERLMLGFDDGKLFLFDGKKITQYEIKDKAYLNESILDDGLNINDELFALSTLNGGVMIIQKKTGKTKHFINFQTGLPDDEIFAIDMDSNGGLWLSHEYGLSRIDFEYPVSNFSFYPGLKGNLNDVIKYDNTVYIASSEGVFYLTEIKDYKEKEITIKVKQKPKTAPKPEPKAVVKKQEEIDISKLSKKEQRRLKWKNRKDKFVKKIEESIESISKENDNRYQREEKQVRDEYRYVKKKIYSLQSISHGYKKIEGLDIKCKDLIITGKKLLVSTNNGLYEITDKEIKPIIQDVYIHQAYSINNDIYIAADQGIFKAFYKDESWQIKVIGGFEDVNFYSVVVIKDNILYAGSDNMVFQLDLNDTDKKPEMFEFENNFSLKVIVRKLNEKPVFFTQSGVFELLNDSLVESENPMYKNAVEFIFSQSDRVWLKQENAWYGIPESGNQLEINPILLNLINNVESIFSLNGDEVWVINTRNFVYKIEPDVVKSKQFDVFFKRVEDQEGNNFGFEKLKVDYTNSSLKFTLSAPYYLNPEIVQYQYFIKGLMSDWSKWDNSMEIGFPFIPPGNYKLLIRARNVLGVKSEIKTLNFIVKPPFWTAWWFYLFVILAFVVIAYIVFRLRLKKLQKDKQILEQKVKVRTAEIQQQKEEILDQKDEIEAQRDMVTEQRDEILKQKDDITSSIMYAQRIQNAVLPPDEMIANSLPNYFILFKPRDIVSGDFYWMKQIDEITVITAADSTGHGVPGAFMSMLGMTLLNEIIRKKEVTQANHVLDELRNEIKNSLRQTGKEGEAKDGMDLALCVINHKTKTLQYSGAYNPFYLYRNNELMEIKADRMPIGVYIKDNEPFTNHEVKLEKGDTFYIFSDGFVDQFGGEKGRKYKTKAFKQLLLEIHKKPMQEQKETLDKTFENWRGNNNQVDDVLVIGIKF